MTKTEFIDALCRGINKYLGKEPTNSQAEKFFLYYELLVDWNTKVNLTAITEGNEVIEKHFLDSLLPTALIRQNASVIDVGTGAGFPSVPILIMRPDIKLTLADKLNKRLIFLNELLTKLELNENVIMFHARAEDLAMETKLRESFDVSLSRAVASLPFLLEWTTPFLKVGGKSIMYKGQDIDSELLTAKNAVKLLSVKLTTEVFDVPWGERAVIIAEKHAKTPGKYPRKAGTKDPL